MKSVQPGFEVVDARDEVEARLMLCPHARALESYLPTNCDRIVVARTDTDGISAPVRYEDHGAGCELYTATFSRKDLEHFTSEEPVRILLCDYSYRFGGRGLTALLH